MIGVSPDDQGRQDEFRESLKLPFPLVGNPEAVRAWGVRWPVLGRSRRVTFVVGRDRRVLHRYVSEMDPKSHVKEALGAL